MLFQITSAYPKGRENAFTRFRGHSVSSLMRGSPEARHAFPVQKKIGIGGDRGTSPYMDIAGLVVSQLVESGIFARRPGFMVVAVFGIPGLYFSWLQK